VLFRSLVATTVMTVGIAIGVVRGKGVGSEPPHPIKAPMTSKMVKSKNKRDIVVPFCETIAQISYAFLRKMQDQTDMKRTSGLEADKRIGNG
jgi:hypothetical protein